MGLLKSVGKFFNDNPIVGTAAQVIGGLTGSALDYKGAKNANASSTASTREQMDFQERMRNTSHQAEVKDLRKAGLNPVLSANSSGASVPGGSSNTFANELSSAKDAAQQVANIQLTRAQTAKTVEDTRLSAAEADKQEILKAPYEAVKRNMGALKSTAQDMKKFYTSSDHPLSPGALYNDVSNFSKSSAATVKSYIDKIPAAMPSMKGWKDLPAIPNLTIYPISKKQLKERRK